MRHHYKHIAEKRKQKLTYRLIPADTRRQYGILGLSHLPNKTQELQLLLSDKFHLLCV